jgi:predicted enzyme related to lactoylglutathione lyase
MQPSRDVFQVEIRTRDLHRAVGFYRAVFDWKIYPSGASYALVDAGAMPVIGILQMPDARFPLGVCTNVLVDDCQAAADRAVEHGGSIGVPRVEIPRSGAYTGTFDPWGNELYFWQPFATGRPNLTGSGKNPIVYLEIGSPDVKAAIAYYSGLVGWSFWSVVFADNYALTEGCGLERGVGMLGMGPGNHGIVHYVQVADLTETMAKVRAAGGVVRTEPTDFAGEGRYIEFEDLDGNRVGALEPPSTDR